jgi:hypothetical protein
LRLLCIGDAYGLRCTIEAMSIKIPPEVRAAMAEIARKTGALGGKTAAKNMTPEQRSARAQKAAMAAAKKRTAERRERERQAKPAKRK